MNFVDNNMQDMQIQFYCMLKIKGNHFNSFNLHQIRHVPFHLFILKNRDSTETKKIIIL